MRLYHTAPPDALRRATSTEGSGMKWMTYRCDKCKEEFDIDGVRYALENHIRLTDDVFELKGLVDGEEYHFCSSECLIQFIAMMLPGDSAKALENLAETIRREREEDPFAKPIDIAGDDLPF